MFNSIITKINAKLFVSNGFVKFLSSKPDLYVKFQGLYTHWPLDTCNRKLTIKNLISQRISNGFSQSENFDPVYWKQEYESFDNILNNYYRDKYILPSGLGQGKFDINAPHIAATGADLLECRRILSNQDKYLENQQTYLSRLRSWFSKFR